MSSNKDDDDLTRIEDLSEFIHDESEEFTPLDQIEENQEEENLDLDDDLSLAGQETDPSIDLQSFTEDENTDDFNEDFPQELEEDTNLHETTEETSSDENDLFSDNQSEDFNFSEAEEETSFEDNSFDNNLFEEQDSIEEQEDQSTNEETYVPSSEFTQESELQDKDLVNEEVAVSKTEIPQIEKIEPVKKETLEEVKVFAENLSYKNYGAQGNPPYSIILKNIRYYEDIEEILSIMLKFQIITDDQKEQAKLSLERGQILIPRLSEFVAIHLSHKFRKFDLDILMGLTEEINPPKSYESQDHGFSSKSSLYNNKKDHFEFKSTDPFSEIVTTTLTYVEGHQIAQHLGVITETVIIDSKILVNSPKLEDQINSDLNSFNQSYQAEKISDENIQAAKSPYINHREIETQIAAKSPKVKGALDDLESIHEELIIRLKHKALAKKSNAIIGINFSILPISMENFLNEGPRFQILCTGNIVWLEKI